MSAFKPFYQGKLDAFCAIYAVLNAVRLTHNLRGGKARELFNETLLALSASPAAFKAVLTQQTDYVALVDSMLRILAKKFPLEVARPFAALADRETFWQTCCGWLNCGGEAMPNRAIVLRFSKYFKPGDPPIVRHWTTVDAMTSENMHLYDSSHDAESIQNLRKGLIVTAAREVDINHLIYVQPDTARFLRLLC